MLDSNITMLRCSTELTLGFRIEVEQSRTKPKNTLICRAQENAWTTEKARIVSIGSIGYSVS